MAAFTDDFNRADGPLTSPWVTVSGAPTIASNQLSLPTGAFVYVDCAASDGAVQGTYVSGVIPRLIGRRADASNYLRWRSGIGVEANIATVLTTRITIADAWIPGDILKMDMVGSTISCYINGSLKGTGTVPELTTATQHGWHAGGACLVDNFSFSTAVPPGPTLVATANLTTMAVDLTVTGATGAITVTRYVQGASPTGVLVRGTFANGRTIADRDAPFNTDLVYIAKDTAGQSPQVPARLDLEDAYLTVMSNPAMLARVIVLADENQTHEGQSTAHKILASNAPLVTVEPPAYRAGTYRFLLPTVDDWLQLRAVLMTGSVMLLRSPCQSEYLDTAFIMVRHQLSMPWNASPPRHRIAELDYQATAPDATPPIDYAWTWADVAGVAATWADVPLLFPTWADVATYVPVPP